MVPSAALAASPNPLALVPSVNGGVSVMPVLLNRGMSPAT